MGAILESLERLDKSPVCFSFRSVNFKIHFTVRLILRLSNKISAKYVGKAVKWELQH